MVPNQSRRAFLLRASGVAMGLPLLEGLRRGEAAERTQTPRRMVFICTPLGMHAPFFFPEQSGDAYKPSAYLELLDGLRDDFTVISGLAHPEVGSTHDSIQSFLTAAPHPENRAGFRNQISIDQFAAEKIGDQTRYPSLSLSSEGGGLSWTRSGAPVPADAFVGRVFERLFLAGDAAEVTKQKRRIEDGLSILDMIQAQSRSLETGLGRRDRDKLDEYYTSVRDLERRLQVQQVWSERPKPTVDIEPLQDNHHSADLIGKTRLMLDLTHLALQTDSTRLVTMLLLGTSQVPPIDGVTQGHHDLSHHGQDPEKIAQLRTIEVEKMKLLQRFLTQLKQTSEPNGSLLDHTMVLFGSNLGNASNHSTRNLPMLLAGGGFSHGRHLAFPSDHSPPLSNLYLSMLQNLGLEVDRFGSSTGTLDI